MNIDGNEEENQRCGEPIINHNANRQSNSLETGGEDTAVLSLGVYWKTGYDSLMAELADAKRQAEEKHSFVVIREQGGYMAVAPRGVKTGGGKGMYYSYLVKTEGFVIRIAEHSQPLDQTPNVIVEMGSTLLMASGGLLNAWADLKCILEHLGGFVMWNKLSRLDLCVDLPGAKIADFYKLVVLKNQFVSRAVSDVSYREFLESRGVTIGSGQTVLRMYDKAYEVTQKKPDPTKREFLEKFRWGGPQDTAVRVEFQLRRDMLKQLGIGTIGDYIDGRAAAGRYLTEEWFRLTRKKPDRKNRNTQRARPHPLWLKVKRAFECWLGESEEVAKRRREISKDSLRLVAQARGCLMSSIADLTQQPSMEPDRFRELAHEVVDYFVDDLDESEFMKRYQKKAAGRITDTPAGGVQPKINGKSVPWVADKADAGAFKRANIVGRVIPREQKPDDDQRPEEEPDDEEEAAS